jgi:hypothetical protein
MNVAITVMITLKTDLDAEAPKCHMKDCKALCLTMVTTLTLRTQKQLTKPY